MHQMWTEEVILNQFVKLLLQKTIDNLNHKQIVRIPVELAFYCKNTFKKQKEINHILLNLLIKDFYLQSIEQLKKKIQLQTENLYMQLLGKSNNATVLLSQIIVRVVIMILSVKLSIPNQKIYEKKFSNLIKNLQIQLIINSQQSLSDLVIKQLEIIQQFYHELSFYECLRQMFRDEEINKLEKWIDDKILEKRKKFDQKQMIHKPYIFKNDKGNCKQQGKDIISRVKKTNKRVTMSIGYVQQSIKTPRKANDRQFFKTQIKNKDENNKAEDEERMKYIRKAFIEKRLSSNASIRQRKSTYVYKSNKKQLNEVEQQQNEYRNHNIYYQTKDIPPLNKQKGDNRRIICHFSKQERDSDSNSRALCPQTPPKNSKQ